MANNESVEIFVRAVQDRFENFLKTTDTFLRIVTSDGAQRKVQAAGEVIAALRILMEMLSPTDRPGWIQALVNLLQSYLNTINHPDAGLRLIKGYTELFPQIRNQKWEFTDSPHGINFSALYEECYKESRIPQLFDELVKCLEAIINSGEIDSVQVLNALKRLRATIRRNAQSDYLSCRGVLAFVKSFSKNVAFEHLEEIPLIKSWVKAFRKTIDELDIEMWDVSKKVGQKVFDEINANAPKLQIAWDHKWLALTDASREESYDFDNEEGSQRPPNSR